MAIELSYAAPLVPAPPSSVAPVLVDAPPGTRERAVHVGRTIGLTGTFIVSDEDGPNGEGIRGEIDLMLRGHWRIGATASVARSSRHYWRAADTGELNSVDTQLMAHVAQVRWYGGWQLRAALAAGLVASQVKGVVYDQSDPNYAASGYPDSFGVFPIADVGLSLGRAFGDRVLIHTGPLVGWFGQRFTNPTPTPMMDPKLPARGFELMWTIGARYAL
jgi:hypothetical protein